jgi:hypothetical protein
MLHYKLNPRVYRIVTESGEYGVQGSWVDFSWIEIWAQSWQWV